MCCVLVPSVKPQVSKILLVVNRNQVENKGQGRFLAIKHSKVQVQLCGLPDQIKGSRLGSGEREAS